MDSQQPAVRTQPRTHLAQPRTSHPGYRTGNLILICFCCIVSTSKGCDMGLLISAALSTPQPRALRPTRNAGLTPDTTKMQSPKFAGSFQIFLQALCDGRGQGSGSFPLAFACALATSGHSHVPNFIPVPLLLDRR